MSSLSLAKPRRATVVAPRRATEERKGGHSRTVSGSDQDRSARANDALGPTRFWRAITVLAIVLLINAIIGMALQGTDWLTAYWSALNYWCAGEYRC